MYDGRSPIDQESLFAVFFSLARSLLPIRKNSLSPFPFFLEEGSWEGDGKKKSLGKEAQLQLKKLHRLNLICTIFDSNPTV